MYLLRKGSVIKLRIINFHTHIYPDAIALKATDSVGKFYSIEMDRLGTVERLLTDCKDAKIDKCVVHSVATTPKQVETINNFIASTCEEHKEFYGFGTMHPDFENPEKEIERILKLGLKGIKIHPDTQKFNIDDEKMFPVYEAISGKLPILIHCGDYRYNYSHPQKVARIIDMFPNLTVIAAHFGGWSIHDLALEYLLDKNCFLDVSSSFFLTGMKRAEELIKLYGAERMIFGTDFPMWGAKEELEKFMSMNLSKKEKELILHKNAEKILKI